MCLVSATVEGDVAVVVDVDCACKWVPGADAEKSVDWCWWYLVSEVE